jgi:hypothetical protein
MNLPSIGALPRRTPDLWVCTQAWDRRPFVHPDYERTDPEKDGYFSFTGYKVDDAGHTSAVRLDRTSSKTWRILLHNGRGFRGVDVVRAWF